MVVLVLMDSSISAATLRISTTTIFFFTTAGFFLVRKWLQNLHANYKARVEKQEEPSAGLEECSVCLGQVYPGEDLRLLPRCNHGFHAHCIDSWLKYRPTCPLCRKRVTNLLLQYQYNYGSVWDSFDFCF